MESLLTICSRLLFDEQRIQGTEYSVNIQLVLCCYKPGYKHRHRGRVGSGYNLGSARCQHGSGGPGVLLGQELGTTQAVAILNFDIDIIQRRRSL